MNKVLSIVISVVAMVLVFTGCSEKKDEMGITTNVPQTTRSVKKDAKEGVSKTVTDISEKVSEAVTDVSKKAKDVGNDVSEGFSKARKNMND